MLKWSVGRSCEKRLRISSLLVSRGKPCIGPGDVEEEDVLAAGICAGVGRLGGSIMSRKKFSACVRPVPEQEAGLDLVAGQAVAQHEVLVAAAGLVERDVGAGRRAVASRRSCATARRAP